MSKVEGMYDVEWHKMSKERMPLFLRNLAPVNPFNPLNLWPDSEEIVSATTMTTTDAIPAPLTNGDTKKKEKKKKNNGPKAKKPKKADLIRAQLAKDLQDKKTKKDQEKLSNSKTVSLMNMKMSTTEGRLKQLYEILRDFHKKKQILDAIDTFWEIQHMDGIETDEFKEIHKKNKKYVMKSKDFLEGKDLVAFQLKEMADRLPPLNLHHMNKYVLDQWQREVLQYIDQKQSMIVCAPTSSGKTVMSSYVSVVGGRVLFVVPTEPLVWQVAALFHSLLKGTVALVTSGTLYKPDDYRIVVGTPFALENALLDIGYDFEYAVYDEVHDLNGVEGDSLERIIKSMTCPFLALSATIGNAPMVQKWWAQFHPASVKLLEYRGRFINLQRMTWHNNSFQFLHPCAAVTMEYLIEEGFAAGDLAFTPKDTYALWEGMLKMYDLDLIRDLEPGSYFTRFNSKRITLTESKQYEDAIKDRLQSLATKEPSKTQKILDSFSPEHLKGAEEEINQVDLWPMVQELCERQLIPAICFQLDTVRCRQLFDSLLHSVENDENAKYPIYREKLEKELMEWERCNKKKDSSKTKQKEEEEREAQEFNEAPPPDVYAPHPDFVLTPVGFRLSSAEFREIKWQLRRDFSESNEDGHPLIRSLRRGIGIYIHGLPAAYLRVVQSLAQTGRLAIVLSDDSLAYGVNMPFRTCVFAEDSGPDVLTSLMVQQMAGRAGRRGLDRQGNIVFAGMSWKRIQQLMRGLLPDVRGRPTLYPTLSLQSYLSPHVTPELMQRVTSYPLWEYSKGLVQNKNLSNASDYLSRSKDWMQTFGLLEAGTRNSTDTHKIAVDINLAKMVWICRDNPAESLCIFVILETLYNTFKDVAGDQIGNQMAYFNAFLRVVDRTAYHGEYAHAGVLNMLPDQKELWEQVSRVLDDYSTKIISLPEELQLAVAIDEPLDGYVWSTVVNNQVPMGLETAQLTLIKERLRRVGDRLLVMHNILNHSGKYSKLEVILRKCFRRIKWILMDSEV